VTVIVLAVFFVLVSSAVERRNPFLSALAIAAAVPAIVSLGFFIVALLQSLEIVASVARTTVARL
jgi:hypothetical protein